MKPKYQIWLRGWQRRWKILSLLTIIMGLSLMIYGYTLPPERVSATIIDSKGIRIIDDYPVTSDKTWMIAGLGFSVLMIGVVVWLWMGWLKGLVQRISGFYKEDWKHP